MIAPVSTDTHMPTPSHAQPAPIGEFGDASPQWNRANPGCQHVWTPLRAQLQSIVILGTGWPDAPFDHNNAVLGSMQSTLSSQGLELMCSRALRYSEGGMDVTKPCTDVDSCLEARINAVAHMGRTLRGMLAPPISAPNAERHATETSRS